MRRYPYRVNGIEQVPPNHRHDVWKTLEAMKLYPSYMMESVFGKSTIELFDDQPFPAIVVTACDDDSINVVYATTQEEVDAVPYG